VYLGLKNWGDWEVMAKGVGFLFGEINYSFENCGDGLQV
jgi:hypothetical protein